MNLSVSSFLIRASYSIVFYFKIGASSVNLACKSTIISLASFSLYRPLDNLFLLKDISSNFFLSKSL